jgi:hypothetical protein
MKKANQMGLELDPTILAAAKKLVAKIVLFMVISILAVGGLLGNVWAQPGGQCIVDQIEREPFNRRGLPKKAFTIILNDLATGTGLWRAPYQVNTGANTGWISGERTANINKGKTYWTKALYATAHFNDDHKVTSPCVGWESIGSGKIKWNKSNRWAIANYLVYDIRERFGNIVGGNGDPYGDNAVDAAFCFRDDLKYAAKYKCNGGARCYDSDRGPWWTGWHSAYNYAPYSKIDDDTSHGAATAMMLYYALQDEWGVFSWGDVDRFRKHFQLRRWYDTGLQYYVPQYPDSDTFPGNSCARGKDCTAIADDVEGAGHSRNAGGWSMTAAALGRNGFRNTVRNLQPNWNQFGSGNYKSLFSAAMAFYGEVGSPRRIGM